MAVLPAPYAEKSGDRLKGQTRPPDSHAQYILRFVPRFRYPLTNKTLTHLGSNYRQDFARLVSAPFCLRRENEAHTIETSGIRSGAKEQSVASSIGSTDLSSKAGLAVPQLLKFLDLLAPASALFFWREDLSK